jgi:hypothetical protein
LAAANALIENKNLFSKILGKIRLLKDSRKHEVIA